MKQCPNCGAYGEDHHQACWNCGYLYGGNSGQSGRKKKKQAKKGKKVKTQRKRSKVPFVILGLLLALLLAAGVVWYLYSQELISFSPKYEATMQEFTSEDIVVAEDGHRYVDSQILLTAKEDVKKKEIQSLVAEQGGEIVGYLELSNDYQIEFPQGKSQAELEEIVALWSTNDLIDLAQLHMVFEADTDSISYDDPWENSFSSGSYVSSNDDEISVDPAGSDWWLERLSLNTIDDDEISDYPAGNNWWLEAVSMKAIWDQDLTFSDINVGIIDSMFDESCSDITYTKTYHNSTDVATAFNNAIEDGNNELAATTAHGTHVSGIIAAKAGNQTGIAGVCQSANLYAYSFFKSDGTEVETICSEYIFKYAIATFLLNNVKVINISMGDNELQVSAWYDATQLGLTESAALDDLNQSSQSYTIFFKRALEKYDFLICKAAGNPCDETYCLSANSDNPSKYAYSLHAAEKDDNGVIIEEGGVVYSEITASYDFLAYISDETVRQHILIVGALDGSYNSPSDEFHKTGARKYTETSFSAKDADIYAPGGSFNTVGVNPEIYILSTVPGNQTAGMQGTSQATPIVTGLAALVWSYAPDLTAEQVVECLKSQEFNIGTYSATVQSGKIMVNAVAALNKASELSTNSRVRKDTTFDHTGYLMGYVYDLDDAGNKVALTDFTISVYDSDWNLVDEIQQAGDGTFGDFLTAGSYYIRCISETQEEYIGEFTIEAEQVTELLAQPKNQALAEYEFAITQTTKTGSWDERTVVDIQASVQSEVLNISTPSITAKYDLSISGYNEGDLSQATVVGTGSLGAMGLKTSYDVVYAGGVSTFSTNMFGVEYSYDLPCDPGVFDFLTISKETLETAVANPDQYTISFEMDPTQLGESGFSAITAISDLSELEDVAYTTAYVEVLLNRDLSFSSIQVQISGGLNYSDAQLSADFDVMYTFSYPEE